MEAKVGSAGDFNKQELSVHGRRMEERFAHQDIQLCHIHGVGAPSATVAHAAEQTPSDELQPRIAAGAAGAATVPKVNPAAA
jgi:hypothetical protein